MYFFMTINHFFHQILITAMPPHNLLTFQITFYCIKEKKIKIKREKYILHNHVLKIIFFASHMFFKTITFAIKFSLPQHLHKFVECN